MSEQSKAYSVFVVSYRPDFELRRTIPIAAFLYTDEGVFYSKKRTSWRDVLAQDPRADTQLLAEILEEMESRARRGREALQLASEWSTSIEVTPSRLISASPPEKVLQELLDGNLPS